MEYQKEQRDSFSGKKVEILGKTYDPGEPTGEAIGAWRQKLQDRKQKLDYLKNCERYWYGDEGFGSEKRKNPA